MEFAPERAAADFLRGDSTGEQHPRKWPQQQTQPELPLQEKLLHEEQDQVDEQRNRAPQPEKSWQQQAAQGERPEQRKLLQPIKVQQEVGPLVQVQKVGQARQPQEELPAEQQRRTILREKWLLHRVEEAEPPSESTARGGLALQGAPQLRIVHLQHQPGFEEDRRRTLRQQHASFELRCGRVRQQECEVKQYPGPQQQQLQQGPQVQLLPDQQQKWQSLSSAERKVGFSEIKSELHFHEQLQQKNVLRQQRAAQPGAEHDNDILEDVLAAVADAEKVAQESDKPFNCDCGGQTVSDEQKRRQRESPQRELELYRQQHQEWPQGQHRQQKQRWQHPGERRQHEQQRQQEQEREVQPRTRKVQLENPEGKGQACALRLSVDQEPSELLQGVRAPQADVSRQPEPTQGENWMVHPQQHSAEAQQLTWQQPYKGLPTEIQRRHTGATEHHAEKPDRNVAYFGEDSPQEMSQSAHRQREGHECALNVDQESIQAVFFQKGQPQDCGAFESTEIPQRPARLLRAVEVELEEEICDFLEADLPPAAVVRWSDYLRLREQQQQQHHHWRQLQQQQQQRHCQLQERQRYPQQCTTDLPLTQPAVSFKMAAHPVPPGELPSHGRTKIEGSLSTTGCVSSPSESASDVRRNPVRQAVDHRYRGLNSWTSPQSTFRATSQVLACHRSAHAAALASTSCSSTGELQLRGPGSVDPGSSAEDSVNSKISGTRSRSAGGFSGCSTAKLSTVTSNTPAQWTSSRVRSSPSSPAARPGPTLTALSPNGSSSGGSARMHRQALLSAAQQQSQKGGTLLLATAAAACGLPGAPLSSTSASTSPAPDVLRLSPAPAAGRGHGELSSTTRRPVSLEAFFRLRGNRPGDAPSGCSRSSLSPSQGVAVPPLHAVESGTVSGCSRLPCPATVTLTHTPERCNEGDAAAPTGASTTSTSATVTSPAARPAGASTVYSSVHRVSFAAANQVAGGPRSIFEGNTLHSEPQPIGLACVAAPNTGSASLCVRVAERESSAAREPPQTHCESSVATAEDQVEAAAFSHPASHRPLQKIGEGVKRRRGSGTAAFGCGNTRKFMNLKTHEECIVCFMEIRVKGEFAMVADCRHCFCCACLARWIKKSKTCPLCRRPVTTVELWRQTPGVLTQNPLAYAFLRRLRPDKNNILKPVSAPSKARCSCPTVRQLIPACSGAFEEKKPGGPEQARWAVRLRANGLPYKATL